MTSPLPAMSTASRIFNSALRNASVAKQAGVRLGDHYPKEVVDDIFANALKKQTGVSLKYMLDFGSKPIERQLILSAQFLQNELPVRLAHRVAELENLPYGLSGKPHVLKVRDWYVESFKELRSFTKIRDVSDEQQFTGLLKHIYTRHRNVVPVMAMGVAELKRELASSIGLNDLPDIHQFLDGFYLSRIGIRMLIGQHIALKEPQKENHIGLIDTKCSPGHVCRDAIEDARVICMREKGGAPEVMIYGDPTFTFPYVPSHLHHMVFELVKNSLRAVYDRYEDEDDEPPPIRLVVAEGEEDITIKVSDEGGGIPRSGLPKIWTYLYTTAKSPLDDMDNNDTEGAADGPSVLAGYGYGLPISRLYARYFGGDLAIISMEGYGTDAYLHLNRLGNVQEPLP
ncbi:hypothetical protein Ndes2526B_g03970 [Nannochloris sp. 'desiccata']|nr:hypothetical protein KSW81_006052 [Chlorella desiccata (nom. nud.)]KAH7621143.1 putative [Pyruvate dehydrogenase (acetyl-transferring)] kinase, mitochondrial [Chlorella desiccata (nom. nud.)]